jgi:hypothetical protein
MAESWGPYRAVLSYSSNRGTARSFMFFGTLSTSTSCVSICFETDGNQHTATGKLDEVELLALLGPGDMRRDERVHEGLEIGSPPLRQCVANLPLVVNALACKLRANWCKALVQPRLEAFDLVVFGAEVIARSGRCQNSLRECLGKRTV